MMRKRFLLSALLLFALVLAPSLSLADDGFGGSSGGSFDGDYGVKYTTFTHDGDWSGYLVKAADSWSAAVYACGGDPARLSADVRSKLSNPEFGGAFYMYANTFAHIMSVYEIPDFVPLYVLAGLGISGVWHGDFGDMMLWYSDAPNSLLESALIDYQLVLNGEDAGGDSGSGDGVYGPFTVLRIHAYASTMSNPSAINRTVSNATFSDGVVLGTGTSVINPGVHSPYYVAEGTSYLSPSVVAYANEYLAQGYDVVFGGATNVWPQMFVGRNLEVRYVAVSSSNKLYRIYASGSITRIGFKGGPGYYDPSIGEVFNVYGDVNTVDTQPSPYDEAWVGEVITEPMDVPSTWPEPEAPVTPIPPEVPTPTAPTVTPDPEPTAPSITWPTSPTLVLPSAPVVETTPEGNDYTSLLMLINDNLNSIDSYLQTFYSSFNGFRSDFLAGVDAIVGSLRNIYQYLGHLSDILEVHCKHIRDSIDDNFYELELYLKGLFEWLPEQLNFDSVYDDSAVVDWLRQIYYKLGGGTYAPNPVADPGGFFGWLGGLVAGFLASLLAGLPGKIQELLSDISDLTSYFPFSAPWDLYALLALFSHDPVTPVFTLPWGLGGGHTANVVVDCSQWDGVMSIVRSVEKIIFAGGLAKLTFDMFKPTDVTGD